MKYEGVAAGDFDQIEIEHGEHYTIMLDPSPDADHARWHVILRTAPAEPEESTTA